MRGTCSRCASTYQNQLLCPNCGIQLIEDGAAAAVVLPSTHLIDGPNLAQRAVVSVVCTLGIYHGGKHLYVAGSILANGSASVRDEVSIGILAFATMISAAATGIANRRAEATGLLFSLLAMLALFVPDLIAGRFPPREWMIGVPTLFAISGVMGGVMGRLIVAPAPKLPEFSLTSSSKFKAVEVPKVPTDWARVILGATAVVLATIWAESIRQSMGRVIGGGSGGSYRLLDWQVAMVAALLGGVVAGANTRIGLRQGIITALAATIGIGVAFFGRGETTMAAAEFWSEQLRAATNDPKVGMTLMASVGLATTMGGLFGGQLFPPRRRR